LSAIPNQTDDLREQEHAITHATPVIMSRKWRSSANSRKTSSSVLAFFPDQGTRQQ